MLTKRRVLIAGGIRLLSTGPKNIAITGKSCPLVLRALSKAYANSSLQGSLERLLFVAINNRASLSFGEVMKFAI